MRAGSVPEGSCIPARSEPPNQPPGPDKRRRHRGHPNTLYVWLRAVLLMRKKSLNLLHHCPLSLASLVGMPRQGLKGSTIDLRPT
mmetsp:Transcript_58879/g.140477  ORF Transcript_58879/g.140477 Transcript_58879/m.140477 type:complete len:85 (-) Transcript_58879:22-276(-)